MSNNVKLFKRLYGFSKGKRRLMFGAVIFGLLLSVCKIFSVDVIRRLVDSYAGEKGDFNTLLTIMIVTIVVGFISTYFLTVYSKKFGLETIYQIRMRMSQRLTEINVEYMDQNHSGNLISTINNNLEAVEKYVVGDFVKYVTVPTVLIGSAAFLMILNWKLFLISFIATPVASYMIRFVTKDIGKYAQEYYEELGKGNALLSDAMKGITIVKSYTMEDELLSRYKAINKRIVKKNLKLDAKNIAVLPVVIIMNELPYIICAIVGGMMAVKGKITVGSLIAFIQLLHIMIGPATEVMGLISRFYNVMGAAKGLFEIVDMPEEIEGEFDCYPSEHEIAVRFSNVSFGYDDSKYILDNLDISIDTGQTIALIGKSGSGKSTIINLLLRLYHPQKGSISFWGTDSQKLKGNSLRKHITLVSQEPHLFAGTIEDNIRYGKIEATSEEVVDAAKKANIHDYIISLSDGYKTRVSESGSTLSGGQRQRISIARAFLKDSKIILLDEPSSALDYKNERDLENVIGELKEGRLILIISHRMSIIRNVDKVISIDKGRISEQGNPEELLKTKGYYANLNHLQTEWEVG